ncbi:unnamed protein product, partial [marine sediment metagenome]
GLVELERIVDVTSRFIVNPVSYRMQDRAIEQMVDRLTYAIEKAGENDEN